VGSGHHHHMMGVKNIMPLTLRSAMERRLGCVLDGWYRRYGYRVPNPRHPAVTVEIRRRAKVAANSSTLSITSGRRRKGSRDGVGDEVGTISIHQGREERNQNTANHSILSASSNLSPSEGFSSSSLDHNRSSRGLTSDIPSGINRPSSIPLSSHHHSNPGISSFRSSTDVDNSHPFKLSACRAAFLSRKSHLLNLLRGFRKDPPFTLQRLAEVLLNPESYYTQTHKLCNGLVKLLGVTGTVPIDKIVKNINIGSSAEEENDVRRRRREIRENATLADERGREQQRRYRRRQSSTTSSNASVGYGGSGHYKSRHRQEMARQQVVMALMAENNQRANNRPSSPPHPSQTSTEGSPSGTTFGSPNARSNPLVLQSESNNASNLSSSGSVKNRSNCFFDRTEQLLNETSFKLSPSPPSSPSHPGEIRTSVRGLSSRSSSSRRRQIQHHHQTQLFSTTHTSNTNNNNSTNLNLSPCRQEDIVITNTGESITRTPSPIMYSRSNENSSHRPSSQRYDFDLDAPAGAVHTGVVRLGPEDHMFTEVLEVEVCRTNSTLSSPSESSDDDSSDRSDRSDGSDSGYAPFTAARVMALNRAQQQQRREQLLQSRALQRLQKRNHIHMPQEGYQSGDSIDSTMAEDSGGSDSSSTSDVND